MASILPGYVTLGRSLSLSGPASPLLNGHAIPSSQGKSEAEKREEIFLEPSTFSTNTGFCSCLGSSQLPTAQPCSGLLYEPRTRVHGARICPRVLVCRWAGASLRDTEAG